jgi:(2Fe-2S) ferredoxin
VALPLFFQTRGHLLVCTGPRCASRSAAKLLAEAWSTLEARQLAYYKAGGTVRLTASGCQGACEHGPNAIVYFTDASGTLQESWYAGVDLARLLAIAEAVHEGRPLPEEARYGPPHTAVGLPRLR